MICDRGEAEDSSRMIGYLKGIRRIIAVVEMFSKGKKVLMKPRYHI